MLADLDETLRELLTHELRIKSDEIDIQFNQPTREWSSRLSRPTVNFFMYDLRENAVLRQHQWERMPMQGSDSLAQMRRSPFRVDVCYLITCWTREPEDEHRLMTAVLMTLFKYPLLPKKWMQGDLIHQPFEVQTRLALVERLTNPADLWSAMDNEMRLGVSFLVTLALDPWNVVTGPTVRTFTLRSGQTISLPDDTELLTDSPAMERLFIGGRVWKDKKKEEGMPNVSVWIENERCAAVTDDQGRFRLGSLEPGSYVLSAQIDEKNKRNRQIVIPAAEGDYDLIL